MLGLYLNCPNFAGPIKGVWVLHRDLSISEGLGSRFFRNGVFRSVRQIEAM